MSALRQIRRNSMVMVDSERSIESTDDYEQSESPKYISRNKNMYKTQVRGSFAETSDYGIIDTFHKHNDVLKKSFYSDVRQQMNKSQIYHPL